MIRNNNQNGRRRGRGGARPPQQGGGPSGNYGNSNGGGSRIDVRQRGNATQLLEKYKAMARDATQNGDRVQAEFYMQYADHYYRVLNEFRARDPQPAPRQNYEDDDGYETSTVGQNYAPPQPGSYADDGDDDDGDDEAPRRDAPVQQASERQGGERQGGERQNFNRNGSPQQRAYNGQRDNAQRDSAQRDNGQRDSAPRDGAQRDSGQRDYAPRDNNQRDAGPRDGGQPDGVKRDGAQREPRAYRDDGRERSDSRPSSDARPAERSTTPRDAYRREPEQVVEAMTPLAGLPGPATIAVDAGPVDVILAGDDAAPVVRRPRGRPRKVVAVAEDSADA